MRPSTLQKQNSTVVSLRALVQLTGAHAMGTCWSLGSGTQLRVGVRAPDQVGMPALLIFTPQHESQLTDPGSDTLPQVGVSFPQCRRSCKHLGRSILLTNERWEDGDGKVCTCSSCTKREWGAPQTTNIKHKHPRGHCHFHLLPHLTAEGAVV